MPPWHQKEMERCVEQGHEGSRDPAGKWYEMAQKRKEWYMTYSEGLVMHQQRQKAGRKVEVCSIKCNLCMRLYRRESDKARHKCVEDRAKPVKEQDGSVECGECGYVYLGGPRDQSLVEVTKD